MSLAAPTLETNPLREGLEQERIPEASCLVIFGASGDLTQRKLIPGLYSLAHEGLLPSGRLLNHPQLIEHKNQLACQQ